MTLRLIVIMKIIAPLRPARVAGGFASCGGWGVGRGDLCLPSSLLSCSHERFGSRAHKTIHRGLHATVVPDGVHRAPCAAGTVVAARRCLFRCSTPRRLHDGRREWAVCLRATVREGVLDRANLPNSRAGFPRAPPPGFAPGSLASGRRARVPQLGHNSQATAPQSEFFFF